MAEMYVDDLVAPRPAKHPWPRRLWSCPDVTWLAERGAVRCERRRWHRGRHRRGVFAWGDPTFTMTNAWTPPGLDTGHFRAWAQTCPLGEWVRYEGPTGDGRRISCEVYMTSRPEPTDG